MPTPKVCARESVGVLVDAQEEAIVILANDVWMDEEKHVDF